MVSGKYSALTGAITREQSMANVSSNLANVSTTGYKKLRMSFESMLRGEKQVLETKGINYNRVRANYNDFSQGPLRDTGNPFDLAVSGEGFFRIRTENEDLLTRKGNFLVDSNGLLVTDSGNPVLDDGGGEIVVPNTDTSKIVINDKGTISLMSFDGTRTEIATIGIYNVEDKAQLKTKNLTSFSFENQTADIQENDFVLVQGALENSNVNMTDEMAKMINNNRLYETYHDVLKSYSKLGEKLSDIGTVS